MIYLSLYKLLHTQAPCRVEKLEKLEKQPSAHAFSLCPAWFGHSHSASKNSKNSGACHKSNRSTKTNAPLTATARTPNLPNMQATKAWMAVFPVFPVFAVFRRMRACAVQRAGLPAGGQACDAGGSFLVGLDAGRNEARNPASRWGIRWGLFHA